MGWANYICHSPSDDHAAKAISCYGHGINSTPHLDRIAKEGVRLDHCYVTNSSERLRNPP